MSDNIRRATAASLARGGISTRHEATDFNSLLAQQVARLQQVAMVLAWPVALTVGNRADRCRRCYVRTAPCTRRLVEQGGTCRVESCLEQVVARLKTLQQRHCLTDASTVLVESRCPKREWQRSVQQACTRDDGSTGTEGPVEDRAHAIQKVAVFRDE